jgi:hypothetical protein
MEIKCIRKLLNPPLEEYIPHSHPVLFLNRNRAKNVFTEYIPESPPVTKENSSSVVI